MIEKKQALCRVEHVTKEYPIGFRKKIEAIKDVSLSVYEGETIGLVGESGSGKSTLGRQMVALEQPTLGTIFFDGRNLSVLEEQREVRTQIQMVFQDTYSSLNPRKTVYQSIADPILYHQHLSSVEAKKRVEELLAMAELPSIYMDRYPDALSGGQRQRVCIARALALNPRFIVWDEPVSALDVTVSIQILDLIKKLQQELHISSVFIGHGLGAVAYVSNRLAVMKQGRLVEVGTTEQIIHRPKEEYTKELIRAARY